MNRNQYLLRLALSRYLFGHGCMMSCLGDIFTYIALGAILSSATEVCDVNVLEGHIQMPTLFVHAEKFMEFAQLSGGARNFGTAAHNATVEYVANLLGQTDFYDVETQIFTFENITVLTGLEINSTAVWTPGVGGSSAGDVTGQVVLVDEEGCNALDFPTTVTGNIALIKRGTCFYGEKVLLATEAGSIGAIIYNNEDGGITFADLGDPPEGGTFVPTAAISGEEGEALAVVLKAGQSIAARIVSIVSSETLYSPNIIATTKTGDRSNVVTSGAHTDSVPFGPGMNDDGSGTIGLLEIALQLSALQPALPLHNALRFGFWTAEEYGLLGSEFYVSQLSESERQDIALYLNFDMIASPNGGYFILDTREDAGLVAGAPGSDRIMQVFGEYFNERELVAEPYAYSEPVSDWGPFFEHGIPYGGMDTGVFETKTEEQARIWGGEAGVEFDPCYHKPCDNLQNLNGGFWVNTTRAAAHSLISFALSLDGIPRPRPSTSSDDTTPTQVLERAQPRPSQPYRRNRRAECANHPHEHRRK